MRRHFPAGSLATTALRASDPVLCRKTITPYVVDTALTVSSADAERAAREVLFYDGIPACSSAGATLCAATQLMGTGKCNRPLCIFSPDAALTNDSNRPGRMAAAIKEWRRLCGLFCSMYVVRGFVERMGTDKPKEH